MKILALLLVLIGLAALPPAYGQPPVTPDPTVLDTFKITTGDTLAVDTAGTPVAAEEDRSGVDTLVNYSAATIDFDVERRVTVLLGEAVVTYKDMKLEAGRIEVDWDKQMMVAGPRPDTVWTDSTQTEIDTIIMVGVPEFSQGGEEFSGEEIAYNMRTQMGRVRGGSTVYEEGYYYGRQFKRLSEEVILVREGNFTTCDADTAHYHFASNDLKVIVGKRVIARPVILYFADVPVLAAPYGIFPQQKGRSSGLLVPTFGESTSQGRFLRELGYYWAISDYTDLSTSLDYYERYGVLGRTGFRYEKRYTLSGGLNFDYNLSKLGGTRHRDFSIVARHNHTIDRYTRLNVDGAFYSSPAYVRSTGTVQEQLNQQVTSNATFSRTWENSPWSLSANSRYVQQLSLRTWSATVPGIRLTHKSGQIFPPPRAPRNIRGAVAPKELRPPWYRAFLWSYAAEYRNELEMNRRFREEGIRPGFVDSTGQWNPDAVIYGTDSTLIHQRDGLVHTAGISANAKVMRYLNLVPRLGASSVWTRRTVRYAAADSVFERDDAYGFFQRTTFDLGSSATTKLYGTAQRPFGIGASFRHTMTPTVGFTYRPDFADRKWGYFETVTLPDGRTRTYDRFAGEAHVSGGTPTGVSEFFNFSLAHLFQMKTGDAEEKTEKRFDLLTWTMGTGVDVKRDSLRWNPLSMSFRTTLPGTIIGPIQGLGLDVTTQHSFYQRVEGRRVRRFFADSPNGSLLTPLELTQADINVGFSLRAESLGDLFGFMGKKEPSGAEGDTLVVPGDSSAMPYNPLDLSAFDTEQSPRPVRTGGELSQLAEMPLSMQFNLHQTRNYETRTATSSLSSSATFSLTPRWNVSFNYIFDLDRKAARNVRVGVTRDLHCWEASFDWSPTGYLQGYFLRIGLKAPQLRDVKVERERGGGLGGRYLGE